jgi:ethanolaminephosphotransferase
MAITEDGVENIANHKYVSGKYTNIEKFLNPAWVKLTEYYVPMWMAPNLITTIGLCFELISYGVTWYFSDDVPSWVCLLNGICLFLYFTLDCMDGKQARRTNSASPLGQLFDHGIDCLCTIAHVSTMGACFNLGGSYWYILAQVTLQFSFFVGQWQEYYTGVLEHSQGDWIGVTEVAYGMALFSSLNSLLDRKSIWAMKMSSLVPSVVAAPELIGSLEVRQFLLVLWTLTVLTHVMVASTSVARHLKDPKAALTAFSKLLSPLVLLTCPFLLPNDIVVENNRYVSLSLGLAFCIITIKIVVFSMAKMAYASFQLDIIPFVLVSVWSSLDRRLTPLGSRLLFQLCCVWYIYRIVMWTSTAIRQLCNRLEIECLTIKKTEKQE